MKSQAVGMLRMGRGKKKNCGRLRPGRGRDAGWRRWRWDGIVVDAGREGRVRPVAERDSHSFETKWLERGMCERAPWRARLCLGGGRHRTSPLRIAYSMLRAVTPQTQLREIYKRLVLERQDRAITLYSESCVRNHTDRRASRIASNARSTRRFKSSQVHTETTDNHLSCVFSSGRVVSSQRMKIWLQVFSVSRFAVHKNAPKVGATCRSSPRR